MSPAKTAPTRQPSGPPNRPHRRRNEVHITQTLEPITPTYLIASRRLRTRIAAGAPIGLLVVGLGLIGAHSVFPVGVVSVGVVLSVVGLIAGIVNVRVGSPNLVLRSLLGASVQQPPSDQLTNLLEGLCVGNGLPVPAVHIVEDAAANAIALGWSETAASLVVTTGLLEACSRIELEGVLAHELTHIKSGDMRDAAFGSVAVGALSLLSARATPLLGSLLEPARETHADMGGASMTRYPPGLLRALVLVERLRLFRPCCLSRTTARLSAPLWLVNLDESVSAVPRKGALDLDGRIGLLAEL